MKNWTAFTCGILREMDWSNVLAAGGSVLGMLYSIYVNNNNNNNNNNITGIIITIIHQIFKLF